MDCVSTKSKRNSLIEFYRFLFAMWVVYYHGYFFLPKTQYFSSGYLAVDFFFMLTGYFIMKDIIKQSDQSLIKGVINLVWKKLKPLGVTLIISLFFALVYFFLNLQDLGSPWGFMWYIKWLIIVPVLFYLLYRALPNKKLFYIAIAAIVCVSYVLQATLFYGVGILRGLTGIGLGVLLSLIPKNNLKIKNFNLNFVFSGLFIIATVLFACFNYKMQNPDHLFILCLAPGLLYFTSCVTISCKTLNYLGGLAFGLYAYQTICRVVEHMGWLNDREHYVQLFCIVFVCAVLDDLIRRIVRNYKNKNIIEG